VKSGRKEKGKKDKLPDLVLGNIQVSKCIITMMVVKANDN